MSNLHLAILWHQHQPYYKDPSTGDFLMPWVRLHAVKDYVGMANLIAEVPEFRCVVNLVPSLLLQIQEYLGGVTDRALSLARLPADSLSQQQAAAILDTFFMANWEQMILAYPRYGQLLAKRDFMRSPAEKALKKFSADDLRDLQVWANLAWFHPTVFEKEPDLRALVRKGRGFSESEKNAVLDKQLQLLAEVIPLHRRLADSCQVELTTTPFYHPIVPLLCNPACARVSRPDLPLPDAVVSVPEDAEEQVRRAVASHERIFGRRPRGMWPSEGSVSDEAAALFAAAGIEWIATDEEILAQSRHAPAPRESATTQPTDLYRPWTLSTHDRSISVLFRDHYLSDCIGFRYYHSKPEDAVADLMLRLDAIRKRAPDNALVLIALDGENCWEYYENQGVEFLRLLYRTLAASKDIRPTPVSEYLDKFGSGDRLEHIFPGSWIFHSFSTWMGHWEKNRGWEFIAKARQFYELRSAAGDVPPDRLAAAREELLIAEGSDWFWWYGDDHSSANDADFDLLFRKHLQKVYELLGAAPPDEMLRPIIRRRLREAWRPPRRLVNILVDGRRSSFFEWLGAGSYEHAVDMTTMQEVQPAPASAMYFGFSPDVFFLRFDLVKTAWDAAEELTFEVWFGRDESPRAAVSFGRNGSTRITLGRAVEPPARDAGPIAHAALGSIIELGVPVGSLGLRPGDKTEFFVRVVQADRVIQRMPATGAIPLVVPADESAYSGAEDLV